MFTCNSGSPRPSICNCTACYTFHSTTHTHTHTHTHIYIHFYTVRNEPQFHKTVLLVLSSQNNAQAKQRVRGRKTLTENFSNTSFVCSHFWRTGTITSDVPVPSLLKDWPVLDGMHHRGLCNMCCVNTESTGTLCHWQLSLVTPCLVLQLT